MRAFKIIITALLIAFATPAFSQDFFSKDEAPTLFNIGIRLGVNTSNRTFPKNTFNRWNVNGWGTGLDAGCVVDINLRDYFSIQPGIFIESRNGTYAFAHTYFNINGEPDDYSQMGRFRSVNVNVPLMVSVKFNLSPSLRFITEAGPYAQYYFHDNATNKIQVIFPQETPEDLVEGEVAFPAKFDAGLKIGAGLLFRRKYSFHIHYLAGGRNAWRSPEKGGKNKEWLFTIGYDL